MNNGGNRICYVDPNDVRGNINGAPLTPDYTDFSIWCNLIVEPSSRMKNQGNGVDNNGEFGMSWDLSNANLGKEECSFFRGRFYNDYNFLTTDYTNIDYSEVKKRTIIEGLQIENIDIGFTNYHTPQVTIKFVDIRGGGFFGREEATHNEYGQLSNLSVDANSKIIDNFYSCFVTFPYPRFKLQVKGFYGKAVTFHLTCTSFNGNFNAQTGNFEIVVQFIGYEYGILGDIPFNLLVAAPMCGHGKDYWNQHVNSEAWRLSKDGDVPITLHEFFQRVKGEISEGSGTTNKNEQNREVVLLGINQQLQKLALIKQYITEFKSLIFEKYSGENGYVFDCTNENENVVFIFSKGGKLIIDSELCEKRNQIQNLIAEYNNAYSASEYGGGITNTLIPNYVDNLVWEPQEIQMQNFILNYKGDGRTNIQDVLPNSMVVWNNQIITSNNHLSFADTEITKMISGGNYKITNGMSQELTVNLFSRGWFTSGNDDSYARYCVVVDFGCGVKDINDKMTSLTEEYRDMVYNYDLMAQKNILVKVGMVPYIGRFYKMVMCHLETFVQVIKHCVDGIYEDMKNSKRNPSFLGIKNLENETDVPAERGKGNNEQDVPPFPAVYRKYQTIGEAKEVFKLNDTKEIKSHAWVGDFSNNWREKDLVDEIYKAAQNITDSNSKESIPTLSGNKVGDNRCLNPFNFMHKVPEYPYNSLDGMLLYIALKAEVSLNMMQAGLINEADAKNLGMYDAYWMVKNCKDEVLLKDLKNTDLYNSVVFTGKFKEEPNKHQFEFVKSDEYNQRHPIFVEKGNNVEYVYMTNKNDGIAFIPCGYCSSIEGSVLFSGEYDYQKIDEFTPKDKNSDSFVVYGSTPNKIKDYKGVSQFEIINSVAHLSALRNTYSDFTSESNKIANTPTKTIDATISKFMYINEDRNKSFYQYDNGKYKKYDNTEYNLDGDLDNIDRKKIMNLF